MLNQEKMTIDFKKYKRIFAFGCSFTSYGWPTWADLIAYEAPDSQYFNYGHAGIGNVGIACKIGEANQRYKFTEDDLVMVMWSTFSRLDYWVDGGWRCDGNVWNSGKSIEWLKKYADVIGYMVRDHGIISLTNNFLKSCGCESLILRSSTFDGNEGPRISPTDGENAWLVELSNLYQEDYDKLPTSLYTCLGNRWGGIPNDVVTILEDHDPRVKPEIRVDGHPRTTTYLRFLNTIGIELSDSTKQYAIDSDNKMRDTVRRTVLMEEFNKYFVKRQGTHFKPLF